MRFPRRAALTRRAIRTILFRLELARNLQWERDTSARNHFRRPSNKT
jgi:hypothetical protein